MISDILYNIFINAELEVQAKLLCTTRAIRDKLYENDRITSIVITSNTIRVLIGKCIIKHNTTYRAHILIDHDIKMDLFVFNGISRHDFDSAVDVDRIQYNREKHILYNNTHGCCRYEILINGYMMRSYMKNIFDAIDDDHWC